MNSIILLTIFGVLNLFVGFRKSNKLVLPLVFLFLAIVFAVNLYDWNNTQTYFRQFDHMLTMDNFAVAFTAVVVLSIIGIVYGAVIAIRQRDLKRLIAYSSISHVGLIAAGIFTLTEHGMQGGIIQMLSHGINVVGLFFIIDIIYRRSQTRDISNLGGITQTSPAISIFFMILLLGAVALPLTNGFVGEFLLLSGVYQYNGWLGAMAGLTIILGAVYMLRMFQGVMFGEQSTAAVGFRDLSGTEKAVLIPLVVMVFWIGLHPNTFLSLTEPTVGHLLGIINR